MAYLGITMPTEWRRGSRGAHLARDRAPLTNAALAEHLAT